LDKLPQIRHEHDLPAEEKMCSCCGRQMDRIGEDVTRELELQPAKLEATFTSARNTRAAAAKRESMRLRFRRGRSLAASPGQA